MNYFLFLLSITSLSQSPNLLRLAAISPLSIGFWRLFGGALIMLLLALIAWKRDSTKSFQRQSLKGLPATLLCGTFFFLHLWTYAIAAQNTKIANCMILFATNPLFTAAGAFLFFKEKITPRLAFAYIFAALGIYQLIHLGIDFKSNGTIGDISALASAALYSCYILSGKKARAYLPNREFSVLNYAWGAVLFLGVALYQGAPLTDYNQITWWSIAGLVVFPTLVGHGLFTYLLNHLNVNWMSCGKLIEPGISALIAFLLFDENLSRETLFAFLFTALAVLILFAPWKNLPVRKRTA